MNSPVSSSSTALISSFGNFLCANFAGVTFRRAALTAVSIASWVIELLYTCLLLVLWEVASSSFFFSLRWAASQGDCLSVIGCAALGGGTNLGCSNLGCYTTLGGVTLGDINRVDSGSVLVGWKSRWGLFSLCDTGDPTGTCTVRFWLWGGGGVGGFLGGCL